jgi:hypothetical protein
MVSRIKKFKRRIPITTIDHQICELIIDNININSKYLLAMRTAAAKPTLWKYYENKYNWSEECINSINWRAHGKALASLSQRQQKATIQFIHRWLPTNASHSVQAEGTGRLCPYCSSDEETHQHFLTYHHPEPTQLWAQTTQQIIIKIRKYNKNIDNTLIKLITLGILEWRTTNRPERPHFVNLQYHQLFQQQCEIGWNQILHGRFSKHWTSLQQQINNKVPTNWLSYTIKIIWQHFHQIWKHRCSVNHGITQDDKRTRALLRLTPKITSLYNKIPQIDPSDCNIFEKSQEELLALPTHAIERLLHKAQILTAESIKRQQQKTKGTHQPIRNYFYRIVPVQQQQVRPIPIVQPINNPHPRIIRREFITTSLGKFFRRLVHANDDPHIPIPPDDYRPP